MTARGHAAELEVLRPRKLGEALGMLRDAAGEGRPLVPLAGGTDLLVAMNVGQLRGVRLLDLGALERELRWIDHGGRRKDPLSRGRGVLRIGALATYTDCIRARSVRKHLPILAQAAREVGGVQIQNRGTVAGNIGNGSPAGDSLPVLLAAEAVVVLRSAEAEREVPMAAYYTGYRASVRRPDELIVEVKVPVPDAGERQLFRKVGTRAAQSISKVVVAQVGHRVAWGSVAPTVVRTRQLEAYLEAGGRSVAEANALLQAEIHPIDDIRSTAAYRRRVAANLLAAIIRSEGHSEGQARRV